MNGGQYQYTYLANVKTWKVTHGGKLAVEARHPCYGLSTRSAGTPGKK